MPYILAHQPNETKRCFTTKIHPTTQHSQSIEWIEKERVSYVKQILNGPFFVRWFNRRQKTNAILAYLIECFVSQNRCIDFCIKYKCCYFNVLLWKFFCFISQQMLPRTNNMRHVNRIYGQMPVNLQEKSTTTWLVKQQRSDFIWLFLSLVFQHKYTTHFGPSHESLIRSLSNRRTWFVIVN